MAEESRRLYEPKDVVWFCHSLYLIRHKYFSIPKMKEHSPNRTLKHTPRPGDGTQQSKEKSPEANWYGTSHEPQEEFTENRPVPPGTFNGEQSESHDSLSEGKPTID